VPRSVDRTARRDQLVTAALTVFSEKGAAKTAVSDVVKAAGVAQGTFYLYFHTKDDVLAAVVDRLVDGMVAQIERIAASRTKTATDKIRSICGIFSTLSESESTRELAELYHRPENRAVHDRMADRIGPRLAPLLVGIIVQGVAEKSFVVDDPATAAWFVLGGLHGLELGFRDPSSWVELEGNVIRCVLRALGCSQVPAPSRRKGKKP
jgi:AcrR family transcriptional regulator